MIKRFHGIDRHKRSSMISILNREGKEEKLFSAGVTINGYKCFICHITNKNQQLLNDRE